MSVPANLWRVVCGDLRGLYTGRSLLRVLAGFLAGGILANTPLDQWLEDAYRTHVHADSRTARTCQWIAKQVGDRYVVIGAPVAAMAAGWLAPASSAAAAAGSWGAQFARTFVAAAPAAYDGTWLLGGDRPKKNHGSAWQPWRWVEKGVSGHAMAGAIPFLVAAGMTANPAARAVLYAGSGAAAWSRLDSRSHYPSQIFLGWWCSFMALCAVRRRRAPRT